MFSKAHKLHWSTLLAQVAAGSAPWYRAGIVGLRKHFLHQIFCPSIWMFIVFYSIVCVCLCLYWGISEISFHMFHASHWSDMFLSLRTSQVEWSFRPALTATACQWPESLGPGRNMAEPAAIWSLFHCSEAIQTTKHVDAVYECCTLFSQIMTKQHGSQVVCRFTAIPATHGLRGYQMSKDVKSRLVVRVNRTTPKWCRSNFRWVAPACSLAM